MREDDYRIISPDSGVEDEMKKFLLLAVVVMFTVAAFAARKALVIGNGDYGQNSLKNAVTDARDFSGVIAALGFEVILKTDLSLRDFDSAVESFTGGIKPADEVLFYYSGHGVQFAGENYLIPARATISDEKDLKYDAVNANRLSENLQKASVSIIILDACRENPFRSVRSSNRGLAVIDVLPGMQCVFYSTASGKTAVDGEGRNSPFTAALLKYVPQAGMELTDVFRSVSREVKEVTNYTQTPFLSGNLDEYFYFNQTNGVQPGTVPQPPKDDTVAAYTPSRPSPDVRDLPKMDITPPDVISRQDQYSSRMIFVSRTEMSTKDSLDLAPYEYHHSGILISNSYAAWQYRKLIFKTSLRVRTHMDSADFRNQAHSLLGISARVPLYLFEARTSLDLDLSQSQAVGFSLGAEKRFSIGNVNVGLMLDWIGYDNPGDDLSYPSQVFRNYNNASWLYEHDRLGYSDFMPESSTLFMLEINNRGSDTHGSDTRFNHIRDILLKDEAPGTFYLKLGAAQSDTDRNLDFESMYIEWTGHTTNAGYAQFNKSLLSFDILLAFKLAQNMQLQFRGMLEDSEEGMDDFYLVSQQYIGDVYEMDGNHSIVEVLGAYNLPVGNRLSLHPVLGIRSENYYRRNEEHIAPATSWNNEYSIFAVPLAVYLDYAATDYLNLHLRLASGYDSRVGVPFNISAGVYLHYDKLFK
jgi:hypothetical protein